MNSTYAQKSSTVQKVADSKAASVLDSSAQNESLQRKADMANNVAQRAEAPRPNNTGMPDNLKAGIESLSGFSMDNVRVHYNSSKPATVQALAYTQGTDIHVAPGQEKCLPHEAWHVAQQMAGRVSPTTNINGMPVNDNAALEHEADVMGEKAVTQRKEKMCIKSDKSLNIYSVQRMPNLSELSDYGIFTPSRPPSPLTTTPDGTLTNNSTIERITPVCGTTSSDNSSIKKVKALQEIAAEAGRLGGLSLKPNEHFYAIIPAIYTTRRSNNNVILKLKYDFRAKGVSRKGTAMDVAGGPGYIVDVSKTKKGSSTNWRNAVMVWGETTNNNEYSNEHEKFPESKQSILADTYRKGPDDKYRYGEDEFKGSIPDAYTKLAGEGARFLCVRNNMQNLNDSTVFWFGDCGVKFSDLCKSWGWSFNKKFDITNDEIRNALQGKKIKENILCKVVVNGNRKPVLGNYFENLGTKVNADDKGAPAHFSANDSTKIVKGYLVIDKKFRKGYLESITLTEKIASKPSANLIDLGGGTVSGAGSSTIV